MKCHASLWVIVASVMPWNRWQPMRISRNTSSMRSGSGSERCVWICRYMPLTCAHISDEMVSRTERAFSRA